MLRNQGLFDFGCCHCQAVASARSDNGGLFAVLQVQTKRTRLLSSKLIQLYLTWWLLSGFGVLELHQSKYIKYITNAKIQLRNLGVRNISCVYLKNTKIWFEPRDFLTQWHWTFISHSSHPFHINAFTRTAKQQPCNSSALSSLLWETTGLTASRMPGFLRCCVDRLIT